MSPTRGAIAPIPALLLVLATIVSIHCSQREAPAPGASPAPLHEIGDGRYLMGTILDVTLLGDDPAALRAALEWTFDQVAEIEAVASRHRADSELSRLNADAGRPARPGYSPHLRALLARSVDAGRSTGGAFDVTVGPLVTLWWDAVERQAWPGPVALAAARERVGFDGIVVGEGGELGLVRPGSAVDLGGIAKGYALDVVRAELRRRGIDRGLLDFGGSSVWAMGRAADGGPWRLEVDAREPGAPARVLALVDRALSVSSSLGESSTIGDRRVGHVVDPRTGRTIDAPRTAAAIGASATGAEVWSTALLVLEASEGLERASASADVETWVRFEDGGVVQTEGFARFWAADSRR